MPSRKKTSGRDEAILRRLSEVLKSGLSSGMFSAKSKGDVVVRAAYLRGISDAIDIVKSEMEKDVIKVDRSQ